LLEHDADADAETTTAVALTRLLLADVLVAGLGERLLERRAVVSAVVDRPLADGGAARVVRHLVGLDEVAPPDVGGIEPKLARDQIDHALAHERALVPAGPAIRAGWRLVRHHARGFAFVVRNAIRTGQ